MSYQLEPKLLRADEPSEISIRRLDGGPVPPGARWRIERLIEGFLLTMEKNKKFGKAPIHLVIVMSPESLSDISSPKQTSSDTKEAWHALFLDWLRRGKSVSRAAELAGVSPLRAYRQRKKDKAFARQWDEAISSSSTWRTS